MRVSQTKPPEGGRAPEAAAAGWAGVRGRIGAMSSMASGMDRHRGEGGGGPFPTPGLLS